MSRRWPSRLWIVRHGQSAGNVARDKAYEAKLERIDIAERDVEVPLSALGIEQARALGAWFAELDEDERPQVVMASPYLRARQTAAHFCAAGGAAEGVDSCTDERLREREFGVLDKLTTWGIEALQPEQAQFRKLMGKFYHRPPGGESWCDVILRLRSLLDTLSLHHADARVMIVAHEVVVLCLRYLLEGLDEARILEIDKAHDVANCGVTEYELKPGASKMSLVRFNFTAPLKDQGAAVTTAPDVNVSAAR